MPIEKGLLLKGLGVCAICAGGTAVALNWRDISSAFSTEKRISVAGLECEDEEGGDCRIKDAEGGGKMLVKKEEANNHFEVTNLGEGKIKVYRVKGEGENSKKDVFKFVIEEADIASGETNKLEEFETYEVKKGEEGAAEGLRGKEYLFLKTKAKEGIKKALGLPWDLPDGDSSEHTGINTTSLKDIKFKGGTASISGGTVTLTISKDSSKDSYPFGYKFTFKNNAETDANLSYGGKKVTIKKGIDVDFGIRREGMNLFLDSWSLEDLAEKVGLKKAGSDWTIKDEGLNIKQESTQLTKRTRGSGTTGKIKLYEGQAGYYLGFKFSIENGDINLNNGSSTITLGQLQSYEIVKESDGNWYFSRKEGAETRIKKLLGLPNDNCDLPTSNASTTCDITGNNISTMKFDGAGSGNVTVTGNPKLTISEDSYPLGYRFTFTSTSGETTITIPAPSGSKSSTITLKQGVDIDYKIKVSETNSEILTLEKVWTADSLMGLVHLKKNGNNNEWTVGDGGASIKQGNNKSSYATPASGNNNAKIRVYEGVPGYNQGYKFVVEEGNTSMEGGESIGQISKYETYEVVKDGDDGQYYFTRKRSAIEVIKEKLGFPEDCVKSTEECKELTKEKLKGIKFSGKGDNDEVTIGGGGSSVSMKIERGESSIFPFGYKFTLISDKDVTIPQTSASSSSISIKANTNTEFKIKESSGKFTLERAWDAGKLGGKIKLTSCGDDGNQKKCSFGAQISVYESEDSYVENAVITSPNKKITYEEGEANYNQGFKFYVEEEVSLASGKGSTNKPTKIEKKTDDTPTYEIAQKTANKNKSWYLVKKGG